MSRDRTRWPDIGSPAEEAATPQQSSRHGRDRTGETARKRPHGRGDRSPSVRTAAVCSSARRGTAPGAERSEIDPPVYPRLRTAPARGRVLPFAGAAPPFPQLHLRAVWETPMGDTPRRTRPVTRLGILLGRPPAGQGGQAGEEAHLPGPARAASSLALGRDALRLARAGPLDGVVD